MSSAWVYHPSMELYFSWNTQTEQYDWTTRDNAHNFHLHPRNPYKLEANPNPFLQYIWDWIAFQGDDTVSGALETDGSWEGWVQTELHIFLPKRVHQQVHPMDGNQFWREPRVYANAPMKRADIVIHLVVIPTPQGHPRSIFIELQCERFDYEKDLKKDVGKDVKKVWDATPQNHVLRPCHAYVIVLTLSRDGSKAMQELGFTLEPGSLTCVHGDRVLL